MDESTFRSLLNGLHFISGLPEGALRRLAEIASLVDYPAGGIVFREGLVSETLFLVAEGHVSLDMTVPRRGPVRILTIGPGELLGWSASLSSRQVMTASATALEPTRMIAFSGAALDELCRSDHNVGYHVMKRLAQGLSQRLLATRLQLLDLFLETTAT